MTDTSITLAELREYEQTLRTIIQELREPSYSCGDNAYGAYVGAMPNEERIGGLEVAINRLHQKFPVLKPKG